MTNEQVHELNDQNFEEIVLKAKTLVVVDFWAEWCGPCKMFAPVFAEVASAYAGKVVFAKLNVDGSPELAGKYSIRSIPTLIAFKDGEAIDTKSGSMAKNQLIDLIDSLDASSK